MLQDSQPLVFDINQIAKILPHRYPFLLVDRVIELNLEENRIVGLKNITRNEEFFQGHFPGAPIMPGVLILEALAQTGGILVYEKTKSDKIPVLLSINHAKFRRPVVPGDALQLHVVLMHFTGKGGKIQGRAFVDGQIVAEAEIRSALVQKEQL